MGFVSSESPKLSRAAPTPRSLPTAAPVATLVPGWQPVLGVGPGTRPRCPQGHRGHNAPLRARGSGGAPGERGWLGPYGSHSPGDTPRCPWRAGSRVLVLLGCSVGLPTSLRPPWAPGTAPRTQALHRQWTQGSGHRHQGAGSRGQPHHHLASPLRLLPAPCRSRGAERERGAFPCASDFQLLKSHPQRLSPSPFAFQHTEAAAGARVPTWRCQREAPCLPCLAFGLRRTLRRSSRSRPVPLSLTAPPAFPKTPPPSERHSPASSGC